VPQVDRFQHLWVLNPGSPTDKRRQPLPTMLVLRIRGARITPEFVKL
jgi:predicted phosphodiesterase